VAGEKRSRVQLVDALALVDSEEFDTGASELREMVPDLDGRELLDALIALGRASLWTEHTEEALACAERSLELADQNGDLEMRGPALALLSQGRRATWPALSSWVTAPYRSGSPERGRPISRRMSPSRP
jgi:hypothetical protein